MAHKRQIYAVLRYELPALEDDALTEAELADLKRTFSCSVDPASRTSIVALTKHAAWR